MLLDDDVIDIDHLEAETNECEGSGRERRGSGNQGSGNELSGSNSGKIKIVSRKFVWNYLVDYFCPSYVLARDIENYIPESLIYDGDDAPLIYDGGDAPLVYDRDNNSDWFTHGNINNRSHKYKGDNISSMNYGTNGRNIESDALQIAGPSCRRTHEEEDYETWYGSTTSIESSTKQQQQQQQQQQHEEEETWYGSTTSIESSTKLLTDTREDKGRGKTVVSAAFLYHFPLPRMRDRHIDYEESKTRHTFRRLEDISKEDISEKKVLEKRLEHNVSVVSLEEDVQVELKEGELAGRTGGEVSWFNVDLVDKDEDNKGQFITCVNFDNLGFTAE